MTALRSVLYLVFLAVSVILYAVPIATIGWFIPYHFLARVGRHWARANMRALKSICGLDYSVQGKENLSSPNCIVLAKHQSTWETIALRALLPAEHIWVLKRELLWVPFFGWALAPFRPIAIDRSAGRRAMKQLLSEGRHWLERGRWIVIFPEGTRVSPGTRRRYGQGGAILARETGYPVIPIAHNAGIFWPRRSLNKYPGRVDLVIGKPIEPTGLSTAELGKRVEDWIETEVEKLPNHP